MPNCSVCNKQINFKNVAYINGDVFICKDCFPQYYIKNLCKVVTRRLRGENHVACIFCTFRRQCDFHISKRLKSLTTLDQS